jgi:hypothetical protein
MRRVYRRELRQRLGVGDTWLRELIKRGIVPAPHKDPGGKRDWWLDAEADAIVAGRNQNEAATAP